MGTEREILRYELDITDVEAKARRLQELTEQIRSKRASGADTTMLEQQVEAEMAGLGKLSQKKAEDASATEKLLRHKEKLAQTVGMLSGQFGEATGRLGGLVEMLLSAGPAAAAAAVALMSIGHAVNTYRELEEQARKAAEAQREFNDAVADLQGLKAGAAGGMADLLETYGARSEANVKSAVELQQRLREEFGVEKGRAGQVAALSVSAGMSPEDAAVLSVLVGTGKANITSPQQAAAAVGAMRAAGTYDAALRQANRFAQDSVGVERRVAALAPGVGGDSARDAADEVYDALKSAESGGFEAHGLPKDLSREQFRELLTAGERKRSLEKGKVWVPTTNGMEPFFWSPSEDKAWKKARDEERQYGWIASEVDQARRVGVMRRSTAPLMNAPQPQEADASSVMSAAQATTNAVAPRSLSPGDALNLASQGQTVIQGDVYNIGEGNFRVDQLRGVGNPSSSGGVSHRSR